MTETESTTMSEASQPPPLDLMNTMWNESSYLMALAELEGRLVRVTPAWTDVLGWSADELTTGPWRDLVHPDDLERASSLIAAIRLGVPVNEVDLRFRTKTGGWRWLRHRQPTVVASGLILAIGVDVTAEVQAADQLERANGRLEAVGRELLRSNEELSRFAFVASHDLHEPLRKVKSFCDLLARNYGDSLDDRGRMFIDAAVSGATRMQAFLDSLLEYSRAGGAAEPVPVDLETAAGLAVETLSLAIGEAGATVDVGPLPNAMGDEHRLTQLFQNLIANGIKYAVEDRPPRVEISATSEHDMVHLIVRDNGVGIAQDRLDDIFDLLTRLHARDEYEGSGIGLATCRRIVEGLGGAIWAESVVGEGSAFHVTLAATGTSGEALE